MRGILRKGDPRLSYLEEFVKDIKEIYYEGNIDLLETRCVAVVGSRKCTQYGRTVARSLGKKIGESGATLVSGLAKGIDAESHKGALEVGGNTIAVLGGGTEIYYPAENKLIQQEIAEKGLLISEHEPNYRPQYYDFPKRNRIISGISESIVVVEAGRESGSLITVDWAMDQGKSVYAVPGNITSHYSFGSNKLIRENATPLIFLDDVLLDMGIAPQVESDVAEKLGGDERRVYEVIKNCGEVTIDEIYHKTNIKPSEINGIITILELKGIIFSSLGKIFVAKF